MAFIFSRVRGQMRVALKRKSRARFATRHRKETNRSVETRNGTSKVTKSNARGKVCRVDESMRSSRGDHKRVDGEERKVRDRLEGRKSESL